MKGLVQELSCSGDGGGYGGVCMYVLMWVCVCVSLCLWVCMWYELHDLINQHQSKGYQWVLLRAQQAPGHAVGKLATLTSRLFFLPLLATGIWAQLLDVDGSSMASIFQKLYAEIQGVFLLVLPDWGKHWHLVDGVQGGYISCHAQDIPTIKYCSVSHTASQCSSRHLCRWKAWLWLAEPNSILYLKT